MKSPPLSKQMTKFFLSFQGITPFQETVSASLIPSWMRSLQHKLQGAEPQHLPATQPCPFLRPVVSHRVLVDAVFTGTSNLMRWTKSLILINQDLTPPPTPFRFSLCFISTITATSPLALTTLLWSHAVLEAAKIVFLVYCCVTSLLAFFTSSCLPHHYREISQTSYSLPYSLVRVTSPTSKQYTISILHYLLPMLSSVTHFSCLLS